MGDEKIIKLYRRREEAPIHPAYPHCGVLLMGADLGYRPGGSIQSGTNAKVIWELEQE